MADENPTTNADPNDETDKKETIRITLPAKTESPVAKRETVRINIPESTSNAPKKETSKVALPASGIATPPPMSRPSAPPMPPPLSKPMSGLTPPPKPPPLISKPTIPLKPQPSGIMPPAPGGSGIVAKPASPKKETARISLPTEVPKSSAPALPKATVKMQQTQPLMKSPPQASGLQQPQPSSASGIRRAASPASVAPTISTPPAKADTIGMVLGLLALVGTIAAAVFAYLIYSAAALPQWAAQ